MGDFVTERNGSAAPQPDFLEPLEARPAPAPSRGHTPIRDFSLWADEATVGSVLPLVQEWESLIHAVGTAQAAAHRRDAAL